MSDLWDIPYSWTWAAMADISEVVGGGTPPTTNAANFGGDVPWITPADLSGYSEKHISTGARSLTSAGLADSGARRLPKGTVLFSSRAPIGYVAIASCELTTNQGFKSFVPVEGLCSDYVYYWLRSAKQMAEALASGTTFLEISAAKAAQIPFPLAPTNEQTRVVKNLEELLCGLDAGVDELKTAQKKLVLYRQSLLKAAVEGTLTEEWRRHNTPTETGAQLLERILKERRARWEAKQLAKFKGQGKAPPKDWQKQYPQPVEPKFNCLVKLPSGWTCATIDQLTIHQRYGSSAKTTGDHTGTPVLRMGNIQDGRLDITSLKYLPLDHPEFPELLLSAGDLLFNRTNSAELVGKAAVFGSEVLPCSYASYLIAVRLSNSFLSEFASAFINSTYGKTWVKSVKVQQVGQANINGTKLAALSLPLPPLAEQEEAIRALTSKLACAFDGERALRDSLKQLIAQRHNILRAAFTGQLVPQDPDDEPANILLTRIRNQRAAQQSTNKCVFR